MLAARSQTASLPGSLQSHPQSAGGSSGHSRLLGSNREDSFLGRMLQVTTCTWRIPPKGSLSTCATGKGANLCTGTQGPAHHCSSGSKAFWSVSQEGSVLTLCNTKGHRQPCLFCALAWLSLPNLWEEVGAPARSQRLTLPVTTLKGASRAGCGRNGCCPRLHCRAVPPLPDLQGSAMAEGGRGASKTVQAG